MAVQKIIIVKLKVDICLNLWYTLNSEENMDQTYRIVYQGYMSQGWCAQGLTIDQAFKEYHEVNRIPHEEFSESNCERVYYNYAGYDYVIEPEQEGDIEPDPWDE